MAQLDKDLPWKFNGTQVHVASGGSPVLLPRLNEIEGVGTLGTLEGVSLKGWCGELLPIAALVPILARACSTFLQLKDCALPPRERSEYQASYVYEGTASPIRFPVLAEFSRLKHDGEEILVEFWTENGVEVLVPFSKRGYADFVSYMINVPAYLKAMRH